MPDENPTVYIVDDDADFRESMSLMVRSMGLNAAAYPSAEAFLDGCSDPSDSPKCMVLDVRMSGLSGLGLQQMLAADGKGMPIIMISGCTDISMAVQAMRAGALDFLEKPISSRMLSVRIREAIDHDVRQHREASRKTELVRHVERLSTRQREVFDLLVAEKAPSRSPDNSASGRRPWPNTVRPFWKKCRSIALSGWSACSPTPTRVTRSDMLRSLNAPERARTRNRPRLPWTCVITRAHASWPETKVFSGTSLPTSTTFAKTRGRSPARASGPFRRSAAWSFTACRAPSRFHKVID